MRTETVEIGDEFGSEYKGKYIFQEISWAKRSRIIQRQTKYSQITGQVVKSDYVAIQAETILASLKEQPENKPISLEKLLTEEDGVPVGLGELFSKIANKLNGLTVQEACFLSEQSEGRSQTQRSRSTGSAKTSGGRRTSSEGSQQKRSKSSS
jgi:hypothetical protein